MTAKPSVGLRPLCAVLLVSALGGCSRTAAQVPGPDSTLSAFQAQAAKFKAIVDVPAFERSPAEVRATLERTRTAGDLALDRIGRLLPKALTFASTIGALDDVRFDVTTANSRLQLIAQTSTDAALRDAATEGIKSLEDWYTGTDYRDDVYRSVRRYAELRPKLAGEQARLLAETLRDYRRAGLDLAQADRDLLQRWRRELAALSTDFQRNVTNATKAVRFTKAELEGVPDSFLQQVKTGDDEYAAMANVTFQVGLVMENARREGTRRRLTVAAGNLAREENVPLIEKILPLRHRIAKKLGYATWADYSTEVKMAGNARTATAFLENLRTALQPKLDAELEAFRLLKVRDTGDPAAAIRTWDWRYYGNLLRKERYNVDAEQLRSYFPYQRVLDGMFGIYQRIFGLKFDRVDPPYRWADDVELYAVSDARTAEPLGLFYLDMFPREGKYNHFATFPIVDGKRRRDGRYQRPVVAVVCNFPTPTAGRPSLLSLRDVETLFHEFGHAMHAILTRATYVRFSGFNVPRDFVEAPSQMLEQWTRDRRVLDSFAADYRDPSKKIPPDILAKLEEARLSTEGTRYRRLYVSFGLMDLALHTEIHEGNAGEAVALANRIVGNVFLPPPDGTAFLAYHSHFIGYDAGFYGYAWADAIAADMATVFAQSPDGFFDTAAGMRLRREIYEPGDSRDVNVSIERFLGRRRSLEPLLRRIGVAAPTP